MHDFAAIHDVDVVGDLAAEIEKLFDQKNGHALLVAQELQCPADILDDRGLNAFGGFIKDEQGGAGDERSRNGQLLLLAAGEIAATPVEHGLQNREKLENIVWN